MPYLPNYARGHRAASPVQTSVQSRARGVRRIRSTSADTPLARAPRPRVEASMVHGARPR
ncbi:hypothetical protein C8Q80DRAFT_1134616 [Daedaleopsis nitida]|nr:hypothetical protein C8Q80DRAFT_1134616 [Daedaleopsis nitida]